MPTALMAPTTSAANSSDITVVAGTPVNVGLYTAAGGTIASEVVAPIKRKNPSGTYEETGMVLGGRKGDGQDRNWSLTAPGVYRIEKPATVAAIGVVTD